MSSKPSTGQDNTNTKSNELFKVNRKSKSIAQSTLEKNQFLKSFASKVKPIYGNLSLIWEGYELPDEQLGPAPAVGTAQRIRYDERVKELARKEFQREENINKLCGLFVNSIEPEYLNYVLNNDSPRNAYHRANNSDDVQTLLRHFNKWVDLQLNGVSSDEIDVVVARDFKKQFEKFHQHKTISIAEFQSEYENMLEERERITGEVLSTPEKVIDISAKLNKTIHGDMVNNWLNTHREKEQLKQEFIDEGNDVDDFVDDPSKGYPRNVKATWTRASNNELKYIRANGGINEKKGEGNDNKQGKKRKVEAISQEEPHISRSTIKSDKSSGKRFKIADFPKGTKPSDINKKHPGATIKPCNHRKHYVDGDRNNKLLAGQDNDHLYRDCPHKDPPAKIIQPTAEGGAPKETARFTLSKSQLEQVAEFIMNNYDDSRQVSRHQTSKKSKKKRRSSVSSTASDLSGPLHTSRMFFDLKHISRSTDTRFDDYTIMYDTCGSFSDIKSTCFLAQDQQRGQIMEVSTMHGDATIIPDICTVPCLGQATVNTQSRFSVLAHCEVLRCPNLEVVADPSLRWIDVKWLPFECTVRFDGEGKVMMADGRPLIESMKLYKERCEKLHLDFQYEAARGITHTELMEMQFRPFQHKMFKDDEDTASIEVSSDEDGNPHMTMYSKGKPKPDRNTFIATERGKALAWAAKVIGKDPKTANWKKHRKKGPKVARELPKSPEIIPTRLEVDPQDNISISRAGVDLRMSVKALKKCNYLAELNSKLGFWSNRAFAESWNNGSWNTRTDLSNQLINNFQYFLGAPAAFEASTNSQRRNYAVRAEDHVNVMDNEVLLCTDFMVDGCVNMRVTVILPGGYGIPRDNYGCPESGEEFEKSMDECIAFCKYFGKKVKMIVADSTPAATTVKPDLEKANNLKILQLPKGMKPAPVDNLILHMKQKFAAINHHHKHGRFRLNIDGIIKAACYISIIFMINLFASSANINGISPFKYLTGEKANIDKLARHIPGSIVLVPAEPITKNATEAERKVYAVALHPVNPELNGKKWRYWRLDTQMDIFRFDGIDVPLSERNAKIVNDLVADKESKIYPQRVTSGRYKKKLPTKLKKLVNQLLPRPEFIVDDRDKPDDAATAKNGSDDEGAMEAGDRIPGSPTVTPEFDRGAHQYTGPPLPITPGKPQRDQRAD